jgi:twitching motility protein PilT
MSAAPALVRLRDVLALARARQASDVHLDAGVPAVVRVDGILERFTDISFSAEDLAEIVAAVADAPSLARFESEGDLSCAWCDADLGTMRAHFYRAKGAVSAAVRLLNRRIPSLESLAMPDFVSTIAERSRGLAIFAGPTGSGKSTTMAALVDRINARSSRRVVTLEDPIEYRYERRRSLITQREIGQDTPNVSAALVGVLRADPDVIVIGELRDAAAMRGALNAAETGHLVLATLHTGDAAQTVGRIVDSFSGDEQAFVRAQLAHTLACVVCQHLVRRAGGRGRTALVEILVGTSAVLNLIREAKVHLIGNAIATGRCFGMQTFAQHAVELLRKGDAEPHELERLGFVSGQPTHVTVA